ncbi:hypothetical protein ACXR2T_04315 [Leucobacter sp. HY1910]
MSLASVVIVRNKNDGGARESRLVSGWTVEGAPEQASSGPGAPEQGATPEPLVAAFAAAEQQTDESGAGGSEPTGERAQMSNATLVVLGVFGGIYLMYTWVWFSWAEYYASANDLVAASSGSLGGVLQQIVFWIAPLAPIGWFFTALLMNRGASTLRLALWIVLGAVVLVPLPMIMWGA